MNEFASVLGWPRLRAGSVYGVCDLLSQVPAVHRPYSHIRGRAERLHVIHRAEFRYDHDSREAWVIVWVKESEFGDRKAARELRSRSYFSKWFEQVERDTDHAGCLAIQSKPVHYGRSPLKALAELSRRCKEAGVVSILTPNSYRYYLSNFQPAMRVGQVLASYMAMFYFGSVARYRPADYEKMLNRKFGWAIEEFLATQGHQFVYLMANELLKREVVCPWALRSPEVGL
ncbi:MAG: hypothetical protein FJ276_31460 [Planctomycetes bacterium]|nr:hypothetical protein [Planctomycetota bacterium]